MEFKMGGLKVFPIKAITFVIYKDDESIKKSKN